MARGFDHDRLRVIDHNIAAHGIRLRVVGVLVAPVAEAVSGAVDAPHGGAERHQRGVVVPHVIPPIAVVAVPVAVMPVVMVVIQVFVVVVPIFASLVAIILPVLLVLIAKVIARSKLILQIVATILRIGGPLRGAFAIANTRTTAVSTGPTAVGAWAIAHARQ